MTSETSATSPEEPSSAGDLPEPPDASEVESDASADATTPPPLQKEATAEAETLVHTEGSDGGGTPPTVEQGEPQQRRPIQIGSRRGESGEPKSSLPNLAIPDRPVVSPPVDKAEEEPSSPAQDSSAAPPQTVPRPSRRDPISPDLEVEVNEALDGVSLDDVMQQEAATRAAQDIELESRRKATVLRMHGDHVFLGLGGRSEGVVSVRQFKEPPNVGTHLEVVVRGFNAEDGLYEVTVPGGAIDVADWSDLTEGAVVDARISGANTGGLECMVSTIRGFIPASQIALFRVENFGDYIGQKLPCVVTEVNPKRRNLVLSHRALLEREKEEARQKLLESLEPGQSHEGVVRSLRDFGAFIDLGGIDGLVHISQLSWERVNHPSEVLSEGQKVRVKIDKVNRETGKIGLVYRDLSDHPWTNIEQTISVGETAKGAVSRTAKFGAFVKLAPGVEGLIHISELAHQRVRRVDDVVREGQEVEVKVLSIDVEAQRIALSLKATLPEPEEGADQPTGEDKPRELAVAQRKGPLKGGVDRPSGGEQFGLRW